MIAITHVLIAVLVLDIAFIALVIVRPAVTRAPSGKVMTFIALFIFPIVAVWMGADYHLTRSQTTQFCLSCHTMSDYGKSLQVDDRGLIPAVHYQNRLIPQEKACFTCHTDYTMYGDINAKIRGLKHVYVQYLGQPPAQMKLYNPYNNRECLHCHSGARSFEEGATHNQEPGRMEKIKTNQLSCSSSECHGAIHVVDQLKDLSYWKEEKK